MLATFSCSRSYSNKLVLFLLVVVFLASVDSSGRVGSSHCVGPRAKWGLCRLLWGRRVGGRNIGLVGSLVRGHYNVEGFGSCCGRGNGSRQGCHGFHRLRSSNNWLEARWPGPEHGNWNISRGSKRDYGTSWERHTEPRQRL